MKTGKEILSLVMAVIMIVCIVPIGYANAASQIPSDAVEFNGHYYKVYEENLTWEEAKEYCESLGGHLVTITSHEENEFLLGLTKESSKYYFWLGATDVEDEGVWRWVTEEEFVYTNWESGEPNNMSYSFGEDEDENEDYLIQYYTYKWNDTLIDRVTRIYNDGMDTALICEWENIYNLGEETYSFDNYDDDDSSGGHCFGMSVTSSGYYLGLLDPTDVGANSSREVYNLSENATVKDPICYYHAIQGSIRNSAYVAGGKGIATDWNEIVDYVENHEYDNKGSLVIGFQKTDKDGHAVNFLRYEEVNGQERIYAYDNNCPHKEVYFYRDEAGQVYHQAQTCQSGCKIYTGAINDLMVLMSVSKYMSAKERIEYYQNIAIYANASIQVDGATKYLMYGDIELGEHYVYELPEDTTKVKITPLVDNATFTYMGKEYSFGEIDEDTYAEFTLSTTEEDTPEFTIINAPENEPEDPTKDCSCNCHKSGIAGFFWKILNFFYKLFKINSVCDCGIAHY